MYHYCAYNATVQFSVPAVQFRACSAIPVPTVQTWHGRHGSATAFYLCPLWADLIFENGLCHTWLMVVDVWVSVSMA